MLAVLLLNRITNRRRASTLVIKSTESEKKLENLVCRTCLATEDLVSIFDGKQSVEKRATELHLATGLEIKPNDGLSQKICNSCIEAMQAALLFRKRSKKAEKTLLRTTSEIKVKKSTPKKSVLTIKKIPEVEREKEEDSIDECSYEYLDTDFGADDYLITPEIETKVFVESNSSIQSKPDAVGKRVSTITNVTLYRCDFCAKEFRMKATYKAHMRFHTHYCVCEACGKRCRNYNQMQEHKRARHGLGRIHRCTYCDYSSATKEALTIHERRHTGERPYVCDHCAATFHRRSNLVQHIAIHLPEKNFQCDRCPKRLKSRKFLQIHKHNAHTGKRYGYLCPICEHRFEKPNKVRAHTRRVHGLPDDSQGPIVRVQL